MKKVLFTCAVLVTCFGMTVVEGAEPADGSSSFQDTLQSFLSSLFGYDSNNTAQSTTPWTTTTPQAAAGSSSSSTSLTANSTNNLNTTIINNGTGGNTTSLKPEFNQTSDQLLNKSAVGAINQTDNVVNNGSNPNNNMATNSPSSTTPFFSTTYPTETSTFSLFKTSSVYRASSEESAVPLDPKCYEDTSIQKFCSSPGDLTDVSFWDLYSSVYSDSVLDGLMMACARGSWCLKDKYDYWDAMVAERVDIVMNSQVVASMCQPGLISCIDNMAEFFQNCSFYYQMVFTSETLDLICKLRSNGMLSAACYKHVIEALHVTLADLIREAQQPQDYVISNSDEVCESPEAKMTQGLICVANSCPGESDTFKSFRPWLWFTSTVDDLISECNYNITKCVALLQKPAGYVEPEDLQMMITISTATMVTAVFLSLTVCVCYRRYRRNAVIKDGYQQLLNEADES